MADRHGLFYFLALQRILFSHPRIAAELIRCAGSPASIFEGDRKRFRDLFGKDEAPWARFKKFNGWRDIERDAAALKKQGVRAVCICDGDYPPLLKEIHDPPCVLFVKGSGLPLLNAPAVAIVGSRKATEHGRGIAAEIADHLSSQGVAVVSGMAYGIDAAAHRGAIAGGSGTIAVMGCGLDIIYPPSHAELSRQIAETGLVISEYPLGTIPLAQNFPQRNRVISGICIATVVVEAAKRSGSLITARTALEQGRDVMAVPGLAASPSSGGVNHLIRDGAALVESGSDVLELISDRLPKGHLTKKTGLFEIDMDKDTLPLTALKTLKEASADDIIAFTKLDAGQVIEELSRLVVAGRIIEIPGRRFRPKG